METRRSGFPCRTEADSKLSIGRWRMWLRSWPVGFLANGRNMRLFFLLNGTFPSTILLLHHQCYKAAFDFRFPFIMRHIAYSASIASTVTNYSRSLLSFCVLSICFFRATSFFSTAFERCRHYVLPAVLTLTFPIFCLICHLTSLALLSEFTATHTPYYSWIGHIDSTSLWLPHFLNRLAVL